LIIHRRDATEAYAAYLDKTTARFNAHISTRGIPVIAVAKMDEIRVKGPICTGRLP
jgi:hypothetical protein